MGQSTCRDIGINPLLGAELSVGFASVARIRGHHSGQRTSCGSDALHYGLQVFDIGRLVTHPERHDHLMVAVNGQLAVVALDVVAIGLHQVAVGGGEIPLSLVRRRAIGLSRQPAPGHRLRLQRFEFRWFQGLLVWLRRWPSLEQLSLLLLLPQLACSVPPAQPLMHPLAWLHQPRLWPGQLLPDVDALHQRRSPLPFSLRA